MQASLHWNDDWGQNGFVVIPIALFYSRKIPDSTPPVIPAQAGIQWFKQAIPAARE